MEPQSNAEKRINPRQPGYRRAKPVGRVVGVPVGHMVGEAVMS